MYLEQIWDQLAAALARLVDQTGVSRRSLERVPAGGVRGGGYVLYNADMVKFTAVLSQQIGKTVAPSFNKSRIYDTPPALSCLPPPFALPPLLPVLCVKGRQLLRCITP